MANGKIRFGKQSGGELALVIPDGVTNTEVIVPESGKLATTENIHGFKNYIINGGFDVWQRGTSFTSNSYNADRWFAQFDGNCTVSSEWISYKNTAKLSWTSAGTYKNFLTSVEDGARKLQGKTLTLSFIAKSAVAGNCSTYIGRGVDAGISAGIDSVTINLTTSWQKITRTFTIPSYDNYNRTLVVGLISMQLLGSSNTVWIKEVQLEEGSVATPFEQRPYGLELALCRRYFDRRRLLVFAPSIVGNYGGSVSVNIEGNFRVSPSFSVNSVLGNYNWVDSLVCSSHNLGYIVFSSAQQTTAGAYIDAICDFSAEL